ncbi:RNA-binding protein 24-B [Sorghum bicolor]|uniref:RRM domain-containing protein n=1 Tax=Sorghum bicolor TaxID=4558 RepID=A0A1W0VS33_SORBI|nr:RNA-binding protein 24-B [Sorghum bicolor]OQU76075.1 hypothetical protein SORBI_3010G088950 [Sorghum bicolor]|eukprot:XP_002438077.2 RNA-binding protein 24-B [Sorghum bicolor]
MAAPSSSSAAAAAAAASGSAATGAGGGPRPYRSRFGDTTLTKVFVGGLAWETPSEGLRQHFERYGDILEAVVITDRLTGRSKGYGFVTFREPEAARRAVQDPNPTIAGRRANCNIASLGPPPRSAQQPQPQPPPQPRGRSPYMGPHLQVPYPAAQAPQFIPRAPASPSQMMMPQQHGGGGGGGPAAMYPSQFGYWYPPDFQYQQAIANPQVLQNYYAQLYGLTSPTAAAAAAPYHQYLGYVAHPPPTPPRAAILPAPPAAAQQVAVQPLVQHPPPAQQVTMQPLLQHPPAQLQAAAPFFPAPSLSHNFRLQLPPPPQAMSVLPVPPNTTESLPADQAAASVARATNASSTPGA